MSLRGKVAIVTGGSSGIGLAVGRRLAREGASVALAALDSIERLDAAVASVQADGGSVTRHPVDVSNPDSVDDLFREVLAHHGRLDIVINSAGIYRPHAVPTEDLSVFEQLLKVNLLGSYYVLNAAARHMQPQRQGKIVLIASLAGVIGLAGSCGYAASKGGVVLLGRTAATELAPYGIQVNIVCPGNVATPLNESIRKPENAAVLERYRKMTPSGRLYADPEDVAELVGFLVSPANRTMYGSVIVADEGLSASLPPLE